MKKRIHQFLTALIVGTLILGSVPHLGYGFYANAEEALNTEDSCKPLPTKQVYQKEENKYYYAKYFGWNGSIPDGQSPETEVPDSIIIHGTPDYINNKIHWRIYYNPSGQEWQKPRIWFAFQNNVKLVGDIKIQSYFNPSVVASSQLLGTYSIPYERWNNYPDQDFYTEFRSGNLKHMSGYQLLYGFGPENNTSNQITHDDSNNSINGITVGDTYYLVGAGSSSQGSAGVKVSYLFTMDTTMPENQTEPINVFGGMVSYQTTVWWYKNNQYTLKVAPFDQVVYTYDNSDMKTSDKYLKNNLPIKNLKQSEYSFSGLPLANMDEEKRNLIDWIQYLGYPYDHSGIYSSYLTAATEIIAQKEFEKIKKYDRATVAIDSSYNPVKDYYHGTQQAIWNLINGAPFEPARYEYSKNGKTEVNEINGGQILLDLARQKYAEHGTLADYLKKNGKDIVPLVYLSQPGESASHADLEKGFIKFDKTCAKDNEKVKLQLINKDNDDNDLTGSKFSLYEGALKTSELNNKQALKEITIQNGKLDLSDIRTNKYYTLVQNSTPSPQYKKADPIIFIVNHNYEVKEVGTNDTSNKLGLDYSSFPRMKVESTNDYNLERFSVNEKLELDNANSNLAITNPSELVNNALVMINPKVSLDAAQKTEVIINDESSIVTNNELNNAGELNPKSYDLPVGNQYDLKAKVFYKGLNPDIDYVIGAQLFKGNDKVGEFKTADLTSTEIKNQLTEATGSTFVFDNNSIAEINKYNPKVNKDIDMGKYQVEPETYTLKTVIIPKSKSVHKPAERARRVRRAAGDESTYEAYTSIDGAITSNHEYNINGLYNVTYTYESASEGKNLPDTITAPVDNNLYKNGVEITPTQPDNTKVEVAGGYWKFDGYTPDQATVNKNNVNFIGKWSFIESIPWTALKYRVTYTYESATNGKALPEFIKAPVDENLYKNGKTVTPTMLDNDEFKVEGGYWKFDGYDKKEATINNDNVNFIGKWKFVATMPWTELQYRVTYTYESATEGKNLPDIITAPVNNSLCKNGTEITPTQPDNTKVKVEDGYWKFDGYTPEKATVNNNNINFIGKWSFVKTEPWTELQYRVSYSYESATEGKNLPDTITVPADSKIYKNGTEITPIQPDKAKVTVEGGYWKFDGYTPEKATVNNNNINFIGKWSFVKTEPWTELQYRVTYSYESATEGKNLPDTITAPVDTFHKNGDKVIPIQPQATNVKVEGGYWKFDGYDKTEATIDNNNVKFIGEWTFVPRFNEEVKPGPEPKPGPSLPELPDSILQPKKPTVIPQPTPVEKHEDQPVEAEKTKEIPPSTEPEKDNQQQTEKETKPVEGKAKKEPVNTGDENGFSSLLGALIASVLLVFFKGKARKKDQN